jgi:magnesium chelatase subunit D
MVQQVRRANPELPVLVTLLSDGKANVALPGTTGIPWEQVLAGARELAAQQVPALVLDTEVGLVRLGRAEELAQALGAQYLPLEGLAADALVLQLRQRRR